MKNPIIPLYKQAEKLIVKSKDCSVFDSENKRYVDFESGDWAANLGHSNRQINETIKKQVDILIHDGLRFRNNESEQLSVRLLEKLGLNGGKSVFLNSGSEAVNLGITIAKNLTGRKKVLKMDCSYLSAFGHGQISATNADLISIPMDNPDAILDLNFNDIAVFVFEPGNSSSLIKYPDFEFIKAVANEIKRNGGLLMANEVTTGFGRTGKWFGFQHYDFTPDIVSVGKALGNGYPISGVSISSEISELFDKSPFRYAQSHQNDALGCAIGLEVINIIEDENLVDQSFEKGKYFKEGLTRLQLAHSNKILDIRARGLMIAIELMDSLYTETIYNQLIDKGFLVGIKENVIRFMPPLVIESEEIGLLIHMIDRIMAEN